jgi:phage shock protein E
MFKLLFFVLLSGAANVCFSQTQKIYQDLNARDFKTKMDQQTGWVLIDVRTPDELKEGFIENAQFINYFDKDFEQQVAALDKTRTYFLYCASGLRSGETMQFMQQKGFPAVYNLEKGFHGWKKLKLPIHHKPGR